MFMSLLQFILTDLVVFVNLVDVLLNVLGHISFFCEQEETMADCIHFVTSPTLLKPLSYETVDGSNKGIY